MLWEDVGLGKTSQCLYAIVDLVDRFQVSGVLVIGTRRIVEGVWRQEAKTWHETSGLTFSLIRGTPGQRLRALRRPANIYLVNYELLPWLQVQLKHFWLKRNKYPPFSMVIYDEVTMLKNATSQRAAAWLKMVPYLSRRVGLTGEPASNGYKDLFGQFLCVDGGARLGNTLSAYQEAFLSRSGFSQFGWAITRTGEEKIRNRIGDITLVLSEKDYLDLPPIRDHVVWVDLPAKARKAYDKMERDFFAELDSGSPITAPNQAAKLTKLLQIASGAVYVDDNHNWELIHEEKLGALSEVLEEASGRPLFLGHTYIHERERIQQAFPDKPAEGKGAVFIGSGMSEREFNRVQARWSQDQIQILGAHPKSAGHGLNLQQSSARATVWFSLPWSLEQYNQLNGRLFGGHRRKGKSTIIKILARDTMDEAVMERLGSKIQTQDSLKNAVDSYRRRRGL
jgi:hypothetical protein